MELRLNNIGFAVPDDNSQIREILKGVSFEVKAGEIVTLFGKSGCGKTTLLNIIGGILKASSGSVTFRDKTVNSPNDEIGFIFQESALFPFRSVQSNVEMGLALKGIKRKERRKVSEEVLRKVGLFEYRNKFPIRDKLSGGMKQRVEIASVLADQAPLILMDEPFSALDDITREEMQSFVLEVWQEFNRTFLLVTHNKDEAIILSDRVVLLPCSPNDGSVEIVDIDLPRPRDRNDANFLHYRNILSKHLRI